MLFIGFAVGYPAFATKGTLIPLILMGGWGLLFCIGGIALRRPRWGIRWWGAGLCIGSTVVLLTLGAKISLLGIVINLAALVLIIFTWKELSTSHGANKSLEPTR